MLKKISDDPAKKLLVIFRITTTQSKPSWLNEHEFNHNGKMYDVVTVKKEGNTLTYYCLNDKNEEKLFTGLDNHIRDFLSDNQSSGKGGKTINLNYLQYFLNEFNFCYFFQKLLTINTGYLNLYKYLISDIAVPPPELTLQNN